MLTGGTCSVVGDGENQMPSTHKTGLAAPSQPSFNEWSRLYGRDAMRDARILGSASVLKIS